MGWSGMFVRWDTDQFPKDPLGGYHRVCAVQSVLLVASNHSLGNSTLVAVVDQLGELL
jgi:hypothetical protein